MNEPWYYRPRIIFFVATSLIILFVGSMCVRFFVHTSVPRSSGLRVPLTSPAEVSAAYERDLQAFLTDVTQKNNLTCDDIKNQGKNILSTVRVPKEKQQAHLRTFFAIESLSSDTVGCVDTVFAELRSLVGERAMTTSSVSL